MRKIYLIAGEASGDLHGANLVRALLAIDPELKLRGWGGDQMRDAGCEIVKHYRDLAFMGFVEVLKNLPAIRANFSFAHKDISDFEPDTVVFIDYPGFNLRLLPKIKNKGIRTVYYIAPQVWAWHKSRVKTIRRYVDELLVILPFEKVFFNENNVDATYVGHPLMDVIPSFIQNPDFLERTGLTSSKPIIALLPGSRRQEVRHMLPVMLAVASNHPDFQWVIAMAPSLPEAFYREFFEKNSKVKLVPSQTYGLLSIAQAALVASGTATLETALFDVPQVVLYKGNAISYQIAKWLVQVKFISLVNLLLDQPLVTELIQGDMNVVEAEKAFQELLTPEGRLRIQSGYSTLRELLGQHGASGQAAAIILQ